MRFRAVLVALDESDEHRRVLQSAAELATRLTADLHGLFVEDSALLRLADLSCVREVRYTGAHATPDAAMLRRELRLRARTARRSLMEVAETRRLQWSFRVAQGNPANELIAAAAHTDVLVVGRKRRAAYRRPPLGAATRRVAARAPAAILIPGRATADGPLVVTFDGSPASCTGLAVSATLAGDRAVLVLAVGPGGVGDAAPAVARAFGSGRPVPVRACRPDRLAGTVNTAGPSLFVYGCECGPALERSVEHLCDAIEAPILLIRSAREPPHEPARGR